MFANHICDKGVVLEFSRENRTNRMCMYIYKEIYFKELAHVIVEASRFKIYRMGWQAGDHRRADVAVQVQWPSAGRIPSCLGKVSLCSIKIFI